MGQKAMSSEDKSDGMDLLTEAREKDANEEHCVRPVTEGVAMAETKMRQENWESYDWARKT